RPARGLGIDFSPAIIDLASKRHTQLEFQVADALDCSPAEPFDYLLLSDLVNDLPDVQSVLTRLREVSRPETRLVVNFFNNRWRAPLMRPFCLTVFLVARPRPQPRPERQYRCTVVIPARNEAGNIEAAVQRTPEMGAGTEIIFVEGGSKDNTWEEIQRVREN